MEKQQLRNGIIKEYNEERGFGFITEDKTGIKYFFHISDIVNEFNIIPEKSKVVFQHSEDKKGLHALNINKFIPTIKGVFSEINLSNKMILLDNKEKMDFLEKAKVQLLSILENLTQIGVSYTNIENNIQIDVESLEKLKNPRYCKKNRSQFVPSGYPQTATFILNLLQKQIDEFLKEYAITKSGKIGEDNAHNSLKSVNLNYPVLNNVYLEELIETNNRLDSSFETYSAEIDSIIITDRAIFIIETKNYKKGTNILVTKDGQWYKDNNKLDTNPVVQVTNHSLVIRKCLLKNNINFELPIIPIIAIGNSDINLTIDSDEDLLIKILHTDLLGTYILNYIGTNSPIITLDSVQEINSVIQSNALPLKKYDVIDYNYNFETVSNALFTLIIYWTEDKKESDLIQQQLTEERKAKIKEDKEKIERQIELERKIMREIEEEKKIKSEKRRNFLKNLFKSSNK